MSSFQKKASAKNYFDIYNEYAKKYKKIALFYELGKFYELFGVDNAIEKITNITQVAKDLGITVTRCNKKNLENSRDNPLFSGFPSPSLDKYLPKLIKLNYTIVIFNQYDDPNNSKKKLRKLHRIISKGTYIDDIKDSDANNITLIYIFPFKNFDPKIQEDKLDVSIVCIDLSTGKSQLYSIIDKFEDVVYIATKLLHSIISNEIIFIGENIDLQYYQSIFSINENKLLHHINTIEKSIKRNSFQTEFLKKIFPKSKNLNPIEYLNLEYYPNLVIAFIILLKFIHEHDETITDRLLKPTINDNNDSVRLSYNTILQLNFIKSDSGKTLFDILNQTSTAMGRRLLKVKLLNPINNVEKLNKMYNEIEWIMKDDLFEIIEKYLDSISDIERLHRKLILKKIHPSDFDHIDKSYNNIWNILQLFIKMKENGENYTNFEEDIKFKTFPSDKIILEFRQFVSYYRKQLNLDECSKYKIDKIDTNIFKKNIYEDLDVEQSKIKQSFSKLNSIKKYMNTIFNDETSVKINHTITEGYFLSTTPKKASVIISQLSGLEVKKQKSTAKIFSKEIKKCSRIIVESKIKLLALNKEKFYLLLDELSNKYHNVMRSITQFIAYVDVIKSIAKVSKLYKYCKPQITNKEKIIGDSQSYIESYVDSIDLRHPIIERLNKEIFIPFNISLGGNKESGLLLFGVNGSGKSVSLKSVAIAIIMAQCGMYVPSSNFTYYPFSYIITKISTTDNLYKGKSLFEMEMLDLSSILEKSSPNTLVLNDEICSSTEPESAIAIVASTILTLIIQKTKFIFTTHFHKLLEIKMIKKFMNDQLESDKKLLVLHLVSSIKNKRIVFNRNFQNGPGLKYYGIEICKQLGVGSSEFIKTALDIRKEIDPDSFKQILSTKTSRYNKDIYMDRCNKCNSTKNLETHHINPQMLADEKGMINTMHKNNKANLVVLCEECHKKES